MLKFFEKKAAASKEETEPELVDSLIFEEKAMRSRYDYLIRIAKENNIKCRIGLRK